VHVVKLDVDFASIERKKMDCGGCREPPRHGIAWVGRVALLAKTRNELIFILLPCRGCQIRVDSARLRISTKWSAKEQDMWLGPDK
jgi:hypothetical protein